MKLAFASCTKIQDVAEQTVWADIRNERPDVLLLLGDNIYLDHNNNDDPQQLAEDLRRGYRQQFAEPNFAALIDDVRARGGRVLATYDDHDFLGNNRHGGDHSPALRDAARDAFVVAFNPTMTGTDIYGLHRVGSVDIAVLDQRYYRRSTRTTRYDRDAILGAEQWRWFERAVAQSTARYFVVASSTTLHTYADESWERYPTAFRRMVDLLAGRQGALVLSGDVHRNAAYDDSGVIELTSSAVARKGVVFGGKRRNYAVLTFDDASVRVQMHSLKAGWRFDFRISRAAKDWQLP
ncbi:MAG TPA: alkaline phosphatase D family protein [Tahibacter sp.]|nr:alkaline phosphatase D family protein [Tahibacter sp.]